MAASNRASRAWSMAGFSRLWAARSRPVVARARVSCSSASTSWCGRLPDVVGSGVDLGAAGGGVDVVLVPAAGHGDVEVLAIQPGAGEGDGDVGGRSLGGVDGRGPAVLGVSGEVGGGQGGGAATCEVLHDQPGAVVGGGQDGEPVAVADLVRADAHGRGVLLRHNHVPGAPLAGLGPTRVDAVRAVTVSSGGPVTCPVAIAAARARAFSAVTSVQPRASINASRPSVTAWCQRSNTASAASSPSAAGWIRPCSW